jgi:hypothetical protein
MLKIYTCILQQDKGMQQLSYILIRQDIVYSWLVEQMMYTPLLDM